MPNRSNDEGLRDRMTRLEDKLDDHSTDIQKVDRNLATVEAKIDGHSNDIRKLDGTLEGLRELVEQRTSASRTVTWKQLIGFTSAFVFVVAPLLSLLVTAGYAWFLPQRIERVVSNSDVLKTHFTTLINASLDERLRPTNKALSTIEQNTNGIIEQLKALKAAEKTTVTRKGVVQRLKHHAQSHGNTLKNDLREIQQLMAAVELLKVPLERQDYKEISSRLYRQYRATTETQQKNELLATFIKAANAKSVSEPTLHEPSENEIERAKRDGNYFEGTIDLSSSKEWKDTVFNKCRIIISKPEVGVILTNVRFLECNFDAVTESAPIRDLLSTYLETTRPTLTFPGYRVLKSYSIGKPVSPRNRSE
jgi:septal ring factor EnvC (AmiA/AmiB activator)